MPPKSTPVEKSCLECSKTFYVKPSYADRARYCSRACMGISQSRAKVAARPVLQCHQCGQSFPVKPKYVTTQKYCSRECADIAKIGKPKKPPHILICEQCGSEFRPKGFANRPNRFCSRACHAESMKGTSPLTDRPARYTDRRKGYVYIKAPDHPHAQQNGYVAEHRLVAERKIGRYLRPDEIVHHRNGDGGDNSPENLEVMSQAEHARIHRGHVYFE